MAEDEPTYQPPVDDPPQDAPVATMTPEQELAFERGKNAGLEAALARQPQPAVNTPPQPPVNTTPIPATPLDMLTTAERDQLKILRATDPDAYDAQMSSLSSRHAQLVLARQAGPGVARTVVDSFRARMAYEDAAYFKDVAPHFDAAIRALGDGILGLLNMGQDQQDAELTMRWKSAKADVMATQQEQAKKRAKPDPPPIRGDGLNPKDTPTKVQEVLPEIGVLASRYKFTEEQLKMLNEQYARDMRA
jgi:hypothetical protein